jgi:hypothetical protein
VSQPAVHLAGEPWRVSIGGAVQDAVTGEALAGAAAQLVGPAGGAFERWLALYSLQFPSRWSAMLERPDRTSTATDGSFRFMNLPSDAAPYAVTVSLDGYSAQSVSVTLSSQTFATVVVELPPIASSTSSKRRNGT